MIDGEDQKRVLVYVPQILPLSQSFVLDHLRLLTRYRGVLAGRSRVASPLDPESFCLGDKKFGRLEGGVLVMTGHSPRLEKFVRAFDPHLIHAHFGFGGTEIMDIATRLDIPLVVTFHGWELALEQPARRLSRYEAEHLKRRAALFEQADLVLAVSAWLHQRVLALGGPPEKIGVHYLGIDTERFDGFRKSNCGHRIVMLGRLVRSKGMHFALEALRLLRERIPDVSLTIIGSGPEQESLERAASEHRLPVIFLGPQKRHVIREVFSDARVLCFPSTSSQNNQAEAFGLAAIEALAMGLPVVGAATGGIVEAIDDGATGFLVPDADPTALAAALEKILLDEALFNAFSANARAWAVKNFDARQNTPLLEERYDAVLARRQRPKALP
jgi:colanic acid/amylovoran biosynthesis glycosyltransferase